MDANEFKSLFIPYHAKLYRTAYSILRNVQDAEDIVQDAYLKLWNRRDELDAAVCREAYCVTLVKNLCMDFIRSSHSNYEDVIDEERVGLADDDIGERLEKKEENVRLRKMIDGLPDMQKKVMWLRDVNECSFDEIGKAMGLNPVNIRATLSKARKKIREQFINLKDKL